MSLRIWESISPQFRAGEDPYEPVTLWRGDKIGRLATGMACTMRDTDPEEFVYTSIFAKYPSLKTVIKRHCFDSFYSPFISLTNKLEVAQRFAQAPDEVLYSVTLPSYRLVVDPRLDKGEVHPSEYFALGRIEPHEITVFNRQGD